MLVTPGSTKLAGKGREGGAEVSSMTFSFSAAFSVTFSVTGSEPFSADAGSPQKMRVRSGWGGAPANGEDGSGTASVVGAGLSGAESDSEGVAMGWRNIAELP